MSGERAFVIGLGEVGRRLAGALEAAGVEVIPVSRAAGWPEAAAATPEPRIVCVGETQLAPVIERLREVAPATLVFVQNGWIRPELAGLPGHSRGLIWFNSKREFFRVLRPSLFAGPLAAWLAAALARAGIAAGAIDGAAFAEAEAEKMGFNCVVGLPLVVHGVTLGDYLGQHGAEARSVFTEAVTVTAGALGAVARVGWWEEFERVAAPLAWVTSAAPKALAYRNGAVVRLAAELGLPAPANARLVATVSAG